ncbi:hypothetical protein HID58_028178 [Brassica napus]|uniref:PROCT domain-containing protein n=5 Tax=Brassica TaxID=3705 RepID=A0ABQ8CTX7_BRANA|nr:hypothetical protein HID58_028178 [Brassica napus]
MSNKPKVGLLRSFCNGTSLKNRNLMCKPDMNEDTSTRTHAEILTARMLLSDRFLGFYMVLEKGSWNYMFYGGEALGDMKYSVKCGYLKEYYDEEHRPTHF